jgi:hypothetical protein
MHPWFTLDAPKPIRKGGYAPQILAHMLFAQYTCGHVLTIAVYDRRTEHLFSLVDAQRMMTQRAMAEVGVVLLAGVEPVVQG